MPVVRQRGTEQAVDASTPSSRRWPAGRTLDAPDALLTHELCERIVTDVRRQAS